MDICANLGEDFVFYQIEGKRSQGRYWWYWRYPYHATVSPLYWRYWFYVLSLNIETMTKHLYCVFKEHLYLRFVRWKAAKIRVSFFYWQVPQTTGKKSGIFLIFFNFCQWCRETGKSEFFFRVFSVVLYKCREKPRFSQWAQKTSGKGGNSRTSFVRRPGKLFLALFWTFPTFLAIGKSFPFFFVVVCAYFSSDWFKYSYLLTFHLKFAY